MLKNVKRTVIRRCYMQTIKQSLIGRQVDNAEDRTFRRESGVEAA